MKNKAKDFDTPLVINNRYEVITQLGAGTLAVVYHCRDAENPDRRVAVKILFPELVKDFRAISRIHRDYAHLRMLSSPNVIQAFDFFENELHVGYSMEVADRGDLEHKLAATSSMPIYDAINILRSACSGVRAIHELNIIHRNIKPGNLLLTTDSTVKIADFCCSVKDEAIKNDDGCANSLDYVPPEYMISGAVDWRTDIYALGVLGYELLAERPPFRRKTVLETMTTQIECNPIPPITIRTDCPAALSAVVMRAMHQNPEQRFQHVDEMLKELQSVG